MARDPSPTVRRRRVGIELRRLRESADLTCDEVGKRLEWSQSKVSRMETGRVAIHPRDVRDLLDLYGITDPAARAALDAVTRESRQRGWWHAYNDALPPWFEVYVGLETAATSIRVYEAQLVPGLLQTPAYARSLFEAALTYRSPREIDRQVEIRMERQRILADEHPPELRVVLDEAVLHRQVGGAAVMREQLDHLMRTGRLGNVQVQVLPFSAGAHASMAGAFTLLGFTGESEDPDMVYLDHIVGALYLEKPGEEAQYAEVFEHLQANALGPEESVTLIASVAEGTNTTRDA